MKYQKIHNKINQYLEKLLNKNILNIFKIKQYYRIVTNVQKIQFGEIQMSIVQIFKDGNVTIVKKYFLQKKDLIIIEIVIVKSLILYVKNVQKK